MSTPYPTNYTALTNADAVDASTTNQPLNTLEQRTRALKERVDSGLFGAATVQREAVVEGSNVKVGTPVYRDADGVLRPGLAAMSLSIDGVTYEPSETAYAVGVVSYKHNSTSADVVTSGSFKITASDLAEVSSTGAAFAGPAYLSGSPSLVGKLQSTTPPFGILIGYISGPDADGEYTFQVNPGWQSPLEKHIHFHHRVSNSLSDWELAADYTTRTGLAAPAGGLYHYRHDLDPVLSKLWPPIPISAVHYDLTGVAADLDTNDKILIDDSGIWWTWATALTTVRHDFYFTRMTFKTGSALVTSLRSNSTALTITDSDDAAATTGDLYLNLDLALGSSSNVVNGTAVKSHADLTLNYGPVVDGIRTDTPDFVTITGSGSFNHSSNYYEQGPVTISVQPPELLREGGVEHVDLNNATMSPVGDVVFVALPADSAGCSYTGKFTIPYIGFAADQTVTIEFLVWARAASAGTMPDLDVEYLEIARPATTNTAASLSTTFTAHGTGIALNAIGSVSSGYYLRYDLVLGDFTPGSVIYFKVTRAGVGGYSGEIGLIAQRWRVDPA